MLEKRVAVITGAARGIGHGIACQLAEDGFAIAVLDMFKPEDAAEGLRAIEEKSSVLYIQTDITKPEARQHAVDEILAKLGRIDVLVNNAGVAPRVRADILETTEESFDFVMGVNVRGSFFMTQLVANAMIGLCDKIQGYQPCIVNISSMSAYVSSPNRGEYCISKAGISMITRLFADRLAEYGINVYEIRPGIIQTDMTSTVLDKYNKLIFEDNILPIRRWGHPADIAKAVSVFAAGMLPYSTGEVINVDGGFHIQRI